MSERPVTLYWRPGCGFCMGLRRSLDAHGLAYDAVDIWEDEHAAAFVRSVAGGSETVPTVKVGPLALVNPTADDVLSAVAAHAPEDLPEGWAPRHPGRFTRLLARLLGAPEA
ncbi:MAG: glutaredoxin domain-containing protein [Nitriliruptorales bacterium]